MARAVKEFESRIMLKESEYLDIVSFYLREFPNKHFLKNTNIYFDTDDHYLKNNHQTLRLRIINDSKFELTIKISNKQGDDEINDALNKKEVDALLNDAIFPEGDVRRYLSSLPYSIDSFHQIVVLNNLRLEIVYEDHLLVIDKNNYNGITDYNLEIESQESINSAIKQLESYIKQFHLTRGEEKYVGKSHRAINSVIDKN